ncbi:MAG: N-acetylneuraminate synthase, partial [Anaerolineales bacterium]|nr:N-acetylneuraminate synthase [Anaerolineales bacterium]
NHNGNLEYAKRLVDIAVDADADAVKFQTFIADQIVSPIAPKAEYQKVAMTKDESQLEMVKKLELPFQAFTQLYDYCLSKNILFLSTPFDHESADFLQELNVMAIKVASGEITNLPFLSHLAKKNIPLHISTGMATLGEIETALGVVDSAGNHEYILLHCVSNYPAAPEDVNLRAMDTLRAAFDVPVGFSDHTLGIELPIAAVALGANIIEKHFTLDHDLPGPDHRSSLEPEELRSMIIGIRKVESALGNGVKRPSNNELEIAKVARKSLIIAKDLKQGTILTNNMIVIQRPGTGLSPSMLDFVVGRRLTKDVKMGSLLSMDLFE